MGVESGRFWIGGGGREEEEGGGGEVTPFLGVDQWEGFIAGFCFLKDVIGSEV